MNITVRHPIEPRTAMNNNARIWWKPAGMPSEAIAQAKYPNARAMLPMTAMVFRPPTLCHQGAKVRYSKENSNVTMAVA